MPTPLRTQRRRLWLATAAVTAAVPVVWWAEWPTSDPLTSDSDGRGTPNQVPAGVGSTPASLSTITDGSGNLDKIVALARRPLRPPLYDPPPRVVEKSPPPPLRITLLGTVIEPGQSKALLRNGAGEVAMVPEGAVVDQARIDNVEVGRITVTYHGQTLTLEPQPR